MALLLLLAACTSSVNDAAKFDELDAKDSTASDKSPESSAEKLSGTCIRGGDCTTPSCPDWVDSDFDGHCDRTA